MATKRTKTTAPSRATLEDLFATLDARKRPEDVAEMIIEVLGPQLRGRDRSVLEAAAKGSLKRSFVGYTSMLQDFARPQGLVTQVRTANRLFETAYGMSAADCADPDKAEAFVRHVSAEIRKAYGASDFKYDRLNREARRAHGMDMSRRRYNKLFRLVARMERKIGKLVRELRKRQFTQIGKSGLAIRLTWDEFSRDVNTACFIAYYAARCNLRSLFTISGQTRPFDVIAERLLRRSCAGSPNWWAIAHVYPTRVVLRSLTDDQKGALLGVWYETLGEIAGLLREVWEASDFNRSTMIARRGNDSTTWNNTANAWNRARSAWISLLYSLRLESVLDATCPGKVLRLMAADVAAWHRVSGGSLDPDTEVWNQLPLPWQVLSGEVACGRAEVKAVCEAHGVNATKRGWIGPRPKRRAVAYTPTPELVHGVSVSSPALATTLRKAGWFSGKSGRGVSGEVPVTVSADRFGFVTGAYDDKN